MSLRQDENLSVSTDLTDHATPYLDAVGAAIKQSLQYSGAMRESATAGLISSPLDRRSHLEVLIEDLLAAGGKLIRPRLAFWGFAAASCRHQHSEGSPRCEGLIRLADHHDDLARLGAALELLHVFGLLQDDVMDEAALRRGQQTAHHMLADQVRRSPLRDDGQRFGESVATLAADLAFALAQRHLRGMPTVVLDVWDDAVLELVQGQRLDVVFATEGRFDGPSTRRVAQAKSGAYTVMRPLELGAVLASPGQPPPWLTRYGSHVGQAFALADDILGVWGEPGVTGKPVGDDISQKKPTTVLGIADQMLNGTVADLLGGNRRRPSTVEVEALMSRMDSAGVREACEREISRHLQQASEAAELSPCPTTRNALGEIAHRLAYRQT